MDVAAPVSLKQVRLPQGLKALVVTALVVGGLVAGYRTMRTPVLLVIDGQDRELQTHRDTVYGLLLDLGIDLRDEDVVLYNGEDVTDGMDAPLEPGARVTVHRARPVQVSADGQMVTLRTFARSVDSVLHDARVSLGPHAEVEVVGDLLAAEPQPEPVHVHVRRAIPFTLHENGQAKLLYTTASTVGEALHRAGITLHLADGVEPGLGERISEGIIVTVDRSTPVTIQSDGRILRTRTHRERVDEVLSELGLVLTGRDYTTPTLDSAVRDDMTIRVVRVTDRFLVEEEPIPFEVLWQPDPDLEIDNYHLMQEGTPGILQRRIRVRFEDDQQIARAVENEYVALAPANKVLGFGTKVVIRTVDTPEGPVEYWRTFRMLATSYSASTAGVSPSNPYYGRTRSGLPAGFGVVAVDPNWIPLLTHVYVTGYGSALAGDTGGKIKGKRIDLGYDDDNLVLWYRWVDVYLLTPVPANIDYSLNIF